jgi:hypothetical protein
MRYGLDIKTVYPPHSHSPLSVRRRQRQFRNNLQEPYILLCVCVERRWQLRRQVGSDFKVKLQTEGCNGLSPHVRSPGACVVFGTKMRKVDRARVAGEVNVIRTSGTPSPRRLFRILAALLSFGSNSVLFCWLHGSGFTLC